LTFGPNGVDNPLVFDQGVIDINQEDLAKW